MRLALQGQADALNAGGCEANYHANLGMLQSAFALSAVWHGVLGAAGAAYRDAGARRELHHGCAPHAWLLSMAATGGANSCWRGAVGVYGCGGEGVRAMRPARGGF